MNRRPERKDMPPPIRIRKGLARVGIYHVINRDEWLHFQVAWRELGKLKRKQFPSLPEAKEYAEEQANRLADGRGLLVRVPYLLAKERGLGSSQKEAPDILTPEELGSLLKNTPGHDMPTVALSAYSGYSLQQLAMLRWEDFDWTKQTIDLSSIGVKKALPLSVGLTRFLKRYRKPKGPLKEDLSPQNLRHVAIRSGISHWKPRILTRSSRIYAALKNNPSSPEAAGVEPKEAAKWFAILDTL